MQIVGIYSFNNGEAALTTRFETELNEVKKVVTGVDSAKLKTKISREKTMPGRKLYSPRALNRAFKTQFEALGWETRRVKCDYPTADYVPQYETDASFAGAFREMDFVKHRVGVDVQFGKYDSRVCNVCAKMTIFHNLGMIDVGIEVVPVKAFAGEMSPGVSYFEQFVWDLEHRGVADIDIPVLVLGITHDEHATI